MAENPAKYKTNRQLKNKIATKNKGEIWVCLIFLKVRVHLPQDKKML
jgi:hypothetical protein